jgi:translation initiation factor IF-3
VKVTIMFRGREVQHPELGERLLRRLASDLEDLGRIESQPNLDGRNMVMVMAPRKEHREAQDSQPASQPASRSGSRRERAARS